jgi:uncharacterized protein (DUF1697 family)
VSSDRYFAFLRAINTGNRRLTNEQLLEPFVDLGFTDVAAYQAAGNVTFRCDDPSAVTEHGIEDALAGAYGFATPTFVRSAAEVAAVVMSAPFSAEMLRSTGGKVQVTFLRSAPPAATIRRLETLVPEQDRVRVIGREWYWLPAESVSTSTLPVREVELLLGEMTMRTLGTVERISSKFAD